MYLMRKDTKQDILVNGTYGMPKQAGIIKMKLGRALDACLNTSDIMPTLLGMMGLPVPYEVEGMDMSEIVITGRGDEPEFAFMQGMGHTYLWLDGFE